ATDRALVERLDRCLPQTQCTRCGYPRCRDYAEAMARGEVDINRCPPGGDVTIQRLADALGLAPKPLDPSVGPRVARRRALIDESRCIGCAKCLDACPVDAIVGAYQWMHTVIAAQCTGCELCVTPCPVDCISMVPTARPAGEETPWPDYTREEIDAWRTKTNA